MSRRLLRHGDRAPWLQPSAISAGDAPALQLILPRAVGYNNCSQSVRNCSLTDLLGSRRLREYLSRSQKTMRLYYCAVSLLLLAAAVLTPTRAVAEPSIVVSIPEQTLAVVDGGVVRE